MLVADTVIKDAWAHAQVRLRDLVTSRSSRPIIEPGDPIDRVAVRNKRTGPWNLFIDNMQIVQYGSTADLPPTDFAIPIR
jgi:hypothetical protein